MGFWALLFPPISQYLEEIWDLVPFSIRVLGNLVLGDQIDKAKIKIKRPCVFKTLLFDFRSIGHSWWIPQKN